MVYPIVAYGDPVLRKRGEEVDPLAEEVGKLVEDMFETMTKAHGVGLAAPQIGKSLRVFVVDTSGFVDPEEPDEEELKDFRRAFLNPVKDGEDGDPWVFEEGCLSIPEVRGDVSRPERVTLRYQDLEGKEYHETFEGLKARVIQHEYDHIEGILFTEHLSPLRKRMAQKKLKNIAAGKIDVNYRMQFPKLKR